MEALKSRGFARRDTLTWSSGVNELQLKGEISCLGNIVISVDKTLEIISGDLSRIDEAIVQTVDYEYNASVREIGRGRGNILRHDNAHIHPGHIDEHHKHLFDWHTGKDAENSPTWVGVEAWPTLAEFVNTVEKWYHSFRDDLPQPDKEAALGLRSGLLDE